MYHSVRAHRKKSMAFFVCKGVENKECRQCQEGSDNITGKAQRLYQENRQHHL